uniref:FAT domain-containing protein n=1 Tax=Anisakis simplex TaxID=6269 RepID=A0A0M3JHL9_ANISI
LPQLFARLNHPVAAVRDTLCTLLERIAALSPHAVCFPAVVGTTQPLVMHSAESDDEGEDSESDDVNGHIEGELLHDAKKRKVEQPGSGSQH